MKIKSPYIYLVLSFLLFAWAGCKKKVFGDEPTQKHAGACNENDIKLAIHSHNKKFSQQMDKCASDAWGNEEKTQKCLQTHYPNLSDGCANCYGKMAACGASHCKFKCLSNHFSEACLNCVNKNCREEKKDNSFSLITCTGLKDTELP